MGTLVPPCIPLAVLLSCKGCAGCGGIDLPDLPRPVGDDTGSEDTADSARDTAPPPPCDVPESEPNDTRFESDDLAQEALACGAFLVDGDDDWLRVPEEDAAWIEVDVVAAEMGSCASVAVTIWDEDLTTSATAYGRRASVDPLLVFPTFGAGAYLLWLWEDDGGWGDDYAWTLRASETKAPVTWNTREVEPDDAAGDAFPLADGDEVLAWFDAIEDYDWYRVEVPGPGPTWSFRVEAFGSGSPVDVNLFLYGPEILVDPTADPLDRDFKGDDDYDLDANLRATATGPTTWYLLVKEAGGRGGPFFWYSLHVTTTEGA